MRTHLLAGTVAIYLAQGLCSPGIANETIVSKPLCGFANQKLSIAIPYGWKLVRKDEERQWHTVSFTFVIASSNHRTRSAFRSRHISFGIDNLMTTRALRQGRFKLGYPFNTQSGLQGIVYREKWGNNDSSWSFVIPVPATPRTLVLEIYNLTGGLNYQRRFVYSVFRTFRLIPSPAKHKTVIISPPLNSIKGQRVFMAVPKGWVLLWHDENKYWHSPVFDLNLITFGSTTPLFIHNKRVVALQITTLDTTYARRRGDLSGICYTTSRGLRGIIHHERNASGKYDWYFAIEVPVTGKTITFRIMDLSGSFKYQERFAVSIFQEVRFVQ